MRQFEDLIDNPTEKMPKITLQEAVAAISYVDGYDKIQFKLYPFTSTHARQLTSMTNMQQV